ncbi:MAG: hypothetical protein H5T34_04295 [Candidatus Methanomethyliales bacterium]|nr:hypothetical protein [Candidatus Methanomethylicales archaeon]
MHITAIIKNRQGEKIAVKATANCDIIFPTDIASKMKYALYTNKLLADYMVKIKKYANKDHAIEQILTDNPILLNEFSKHYEAHFIPEACVDEEINKVMGVAKG